MGLDMYMFKCKVPAYLAARSRKSKIVRLCQEVLDNMEDGEPLSENACLVDYWRKANQIYGWFLNNTMVKCDEPGPYQIKWEELLELKAVCKQVLDFGVGMDGMPVAVTCEKLLPTVEGPFWGSTEYDECYLEDVLSTYNLLDDLLGTSDWDNEVILLYAEW